MLQRARQAQQFQGNLCDQRVSLSMGAALGAFLGQLAGAAPVRGWNDSTISWGVAETVAEINSMKTVAGVSKSAEDIKKFCKM